MDIGLFNIRENMKKTILFLTILVIQACSVSVKESNFIVNDNKKTILTPAQLTEINEMKAGIQTSVLTINHPDGIKTKGFWIKQSKSTSVIIYFGGNSMRINDVYKEMLPELLSLNTDIVWLDHRGLGGSEGKANLNNLMQDGLDTYKYVTQNTNNKVIVYGLSLGSFIAGNIAKNNNSVAGLILEASSTNVSEWVDKAVPWYIKPLSTINIEEKLKSVGNDDVVKNYKGPLFILVGEDDKVTPVELNQALFTASISLNKQIFIAKERKHGNAITSPEGKRKLLTFIRQL